MSEYLEPSERIVQLLRKIYRDGPFKAIYDGDPDLIPKSNLPAICVVQMEDENEPGATMTEDVSVEIQIRVLFNKQDDWGVKSDRADLTDRRIRRIVEARDAETKMYLPQSIKGALQTQLGLDDGAQLGQRMRFALGSAVRPSEVVTREGVLTISIEYYVPKVPLIQA